MVFDGIVMNYGDHYDEVSNIFTCPVRGLYWFNVNVLMYSTYRMHAQIMLDGSLLVAGYTTDAVTFDSGSNSVVTLCESGQQDIKTLFVLRMCLYAAD